MKLYLIVHLNWNFNHLKKNNSSLEVVEVCMKRYAVNLVYFSIFYESTLFKRISLKNMSNKKNTHWNCISRTHKRAHIDQSVLHQNCFCLKMLSTAGLSYKLGENEMVSIGNWDADADVDLLGRPNIGKCTLFLYSQRKRCAGRVACKFGEGDISESGRRAKLCGTKDGTIEFMQMLLLNGNGFPTDTCFCVWYSRWKGV